MTVYHTLGNALILPLNVLHLFLYLDRRRGNPPLIAAGLILLSLPWFAGYCRYLDAPTPGWLLPAVLLSPLYCFPIFVFFLFDAPWRRILMATGFVVTFSCAAQMLCHAAVRALFPPETARMAIIPVQLAVYAVLFPLLAKYSREPVRRAMDALEGERRYFLILVPMVCILGGAIVGGLYAAPAAPVPLAAVTPLLATLVFYAQLYYFMAMRKRAWRLADRLEAAEKLLPMYESHHRELAKRESALAAQRHDFRHVLGQLAVLAKEEGSMATAERIRALTGAEAEIALRRYSANPALNAVASFYFSLAEASGTRCEAELSVPETLPLSDAEIAVLVGNALDNCVKATRPLGPDGRIRVSARTAKGCLVFKFGNNVSAGRFEKGQGLGLASIRLLCERYDGMLDTEERDGEFVLTAAIPMNTQPAS